MGLDIRIPIGLMFSIIGLMLSLYGAIAGHDIYQRSLGFNVNLIWGLVLLACGVLTLLATRRSAKRNS
jgi:type III secretory pathway component EscS